LQKKSLKLGYHKPYKHKKYTYNKQFFSEPNLINSYYSGLISADWNIRKRDGYYPIFQASISAKDKVLLDDFKKHCGYTGPVSEYQRQTSLSKNIQNISQICVAGCYEWATDLKRNFQITERKTKNQIPPDLSIDNKLAFICGYLDGDGSVTYNKANNTIQLRVWSSNKKILQWINESLSELISFNPKNLRFTQSNCWELCFVAHQAAVLIDLLGGLPVDNLDRKWRAPKILEVIDRIKIKHPNKFLTL